MTERDPLKSPLGKGGTRTGVSKGFYVRFQETFEKGKGAGGARKAELGEN